MKQQLKINIIMKIKTGIDTAVEYMTPAVEVAELELQDVLCSSGDPQSDFIENLNLGEEFNGWN